MTNSKKAVGKERIIKLVLLLLLLVYAAVIVRLVLFRNGLRSEIRMVFFRPFDLVREYRAGEKSLSFLAINYLGNIGMTVPLGVLLPAIFPRLRYRWVVLIGFLTVIAIESAQYLLSSGYSDIDDVILNTLGVMLGAGCFFLLLGGHRHLFRAQLLSLIFLLLFAAVSGAGAWRYRPDLLPVGALVGGQIAGEEPDAYDMRVFCYKMSHGEVFLDSRTAEDRDGNRVEDAKGAYPLQDTAVFALEGDEEDSYRVVGIEDMVRTVTDSGGGFIRIWMNEEGACRMVILERAEG